MENTFKRTLSQTADAMTQRSDAMIQQSEAMTPQGSDQRNSCEEDEK